MYVYISHQGPLVWSGRERDNRCLDLASLPVQIRAWYRLAPTCIPGSVLALKFHPWKNALLSVFLNKSPSLYLSKLCGLGFGFFYVSSPGSASSVTEDEVTHGNVCFSTCEGSVKCSSTSRVLVQIPEVSEAQVLLGLSSGTWWNRVVGVGWFVCFLVFLTRCIFDCSHPLHPLLGGSFGYVLLLGGLLDWRIFLFLAQQKYLCSKILLVEPSSSVDPSSFCNDFNLFFLCFQVIFFNRAQQQWELVSIKAFKSIYQAGYIVQFLFSWLETIKTVKVLLFQYIQWKKYSISAC